MGIKKGIVELVCHLLNSNIWKTHLVEYTGDNKTLKDVIIYNIIQSIKTKSTKPGYQDKTHRPSQVSNFPQWN